MDNKTLLNIINNKNIFYCECGSFGYEDRPVCFCDMNKINWKLLKKISELRNKYGAQNGK